MSTIDKVPTTDDVEYYVKLPHAVHLTKQTEDSDEYWIAEILELPGCTADGESPDEAVENIEDAKRLWIETHLEDGYEVPVPVSVDSYSGKLLVRMPRSLHRRLAYEALREGVSLNQHLVSRLSGAVEPSAHIREGDARAQQLAGD